MKEKVIVVKGICRHFTGDCEIVIVGVRRNATDAQKLGDEWCKDKNEQFKYEGRNVHASYQLVSRELL